MTRSGLRDLATCHPDAGAVPCDLVDMTEVSTPGHFYVKISKLTEKWFSKHCNKEFMTHMNALLDRLHNSLTCHGQNVLPGKLF